MNQRKNPDIAFLWRPEEMNPEVIEMARLTQTRAILDLTGGESLDACDGLLGTADATGVSDIMVLPSWLEEDRFQDILVSGGIENVWVEIHPRFADGNLPALLNALEKIPGHCRFFPVMGHIPWLLEILDRYPEIPNLVLKGNEASGFVSSETILTLYATLQKLICDRRISVKLFIWGGIGTPEAAGAFLSAGAAGIVFESLHWLTDLVRMDDGVRERIGKLRPEQTEVVGIAQGTPCRLFNKGNSKAVKELASLGEENSVLAQKIQTFSVHPLDSRFSVRELIPLGVEAGFAASFAERYGRGTEQALREFVADVTDHAAAGNRMTAPRDKHPAAREMGTVYPFIQGAMSWITDVPRFARIICEAGALPTVALGLLHGRELKEKLGKLSQVMAGRPYGVNFIALPENPHREEQLAWIKEQKPRFAVIAAGDPSHARELLRRGIEVIYVAPHAEMVKLAFESGIRYVICEGNEAGGHVGPHTTTTLAQTVFELKRRRPALFRDRFVILAGGIFNRVTAFIAHRLGADAIQLGTAYLATEEIVKTGALAELYQRMVLNSEPGGTAVSGARQGLGVRALATPKSKKIRSLENELHEKGKGSGEIRRRIEDISVGSLLIAARGVQREAGNSISLDEKTCAREGQFMSGACAGAIRKPYSVVELHRELAKGFCQNGPWVGETVSEKPGCLVAQGNGFTASAIVPSAKDGNRVAITGMSIFNALGNGPEAVWKAVTAMKSGIGPVPPSKWDHGLYYDPHPQTPDRTYCRVGAFADLDVSRKALGIAPHDFETMAGATRMTLWLAQKAVRESGILESNIPRERIGVFISQNSGEAAGTLTDLLIRGNAHHILEAVKRVVPLTPETGKAVIEEIRAGYKPTDDTTLLGRLNCAAAGFICLKYGIQGPSFSLSAACATSLAAVYTAVQLIRNGVIDAALVGGAEEPLLPLHFVEFSALGVLAGLKGAERLPAEAGRPFDTERDGMVLGEGGGMVVLERESVARKRGAVIHGVITGVGAGNSHLGLVESSRVTQAAAIRASFEDAGYGPGTVDLVECHATGTVQGDVEEVQALKTFYRTDGPTAITSFKSQIGHTLGASGVNSLIRGLLAMNAGLLPPSVNCTRPDPALGIEGSPLWIPTEPMEWKPGDKGPRRVQINAFGFGGSNYVLQMEQCVNGAGEKTAGPRKISALTPEMTADPSLLEGISFFHTRIGEKTCRLAVLAGNGDEAGFKLKDFQEDFRLPLSAKQEKRLARKGIFLHEKKERPPAVAFVFPGQGSHYAGMGRDLYEKFPLIRKWLDLADSLAEFDLLQLLFQGTEEDLKKTWVQQPALFALECAIAHQLMAWGVHPKAVAGHSVGEMAALWAADVYSFEDGFRLVNERARCMKTASRLHKNTGMMAVHAGLDSVEDAVSRQKGVSVANINSPNQVVLSGHMEALSAMGRELKRLGHRFTLLNVEMAFHSPMMKSSREAFAAAVRDIPLHAPRVPVISNTSGRPFPSHESGIRDMIVSQLELPVCWLADMEALQNDYDIRCFIEIGPKKVLTNLLLDTLDGENGIPTCLPSGEEKAFRGAAAKLFVKGILKLPKTLSFMPLNGPASSTEDRPKGVENGSSSPGSTVEAVMGIIMEATGYERDEIDEHMDLRDDLAIRSSRLPIILDAMEHRFGITIDLTDFIHLRTVSEIAERVEQWILKGPDAPEKSKRPLPVREDIKRILFSKTPLTEGKPRPFSFHPGGSVCILSTGKRGRVYHPMEKLFQGEWGLTTVFRKLHWGSGGLRSRWRMNKGRAQALGRLKSIPSLTGMVLDIRGFPLEQYDSMNGAAGLLEQLFSLVKAATESPNLTFVLLLHDCREDGSGGVLAEGVLGMFLSCAHEYPSVAFRTVGLDRGTNPEVALLKALKDHDPVIERIHGNIAAYTMEGSPAPIVYRRSSEMGLGGKEVVVFSGGGSGITARLARSLIPLGVRAVLVGRTKIDGDRDFSGLLTGDAPVDEVFRGWIDEKHPDISKEASEKEMIRFRKGLEVVRTLKDLRAQGMDASYYTCDMTRPEEVETLFEAVTAQYGGIDGIVHGAGMIRDGWMRDMTTDDFSSVIHVKISGALNLFQAAKTRRIRFFTCLSSVVSILGNPGQVNYAAANRMMSALVHFLEQKNPSIRFKSLILPPIEGAGMAENAWIRKIMSHRDIGYVHVDELAEIFVREHCFDLSAHSRVMFMRSLPHMDSVPLNTAVSVPSPERISAAGLLFRREDFPMIDSVPRVDLQGGMLLAHRAFSHEKDAWLKDHRPLKAMKHPVVSGIMLIETLMEAARMLYPYLSPRKILNAWFLDMIPCPLGTVRSARILCRRVASKNGKITCEVSLETGSISSGNPEKNPGVVCRAQVVLGHGNEMPGEGWNPVHVPMDELDTPRVNVDGFLDHYERHSGLQGRYRMAMSLYGTGPGVVGGRMAYGEGNDFFHLEKAHYQYSPYLLEMLFHLPRFHGVVRNTESSENLVPAGIEEMVLFRKCRAGEKISSFARMKNKTRGGSLWDITAFDENEEPLMVVKGLRMQKAPE